MGILAFVRSIFEPTVEVNKERWNKLKEVISDRDLDTLDFDTWQTRYIKKRQLVKLENLVYDIKRDAEYLRFGPLLSSRIRTHLDNICQCYEKYRELVQVPMWQPVGVSLDDEKDNNDEREYGWLFNKDYFFGSNYKGQRYDEHLEAAKRCVEEIRMEYKAIGLLSNLHFFEALFARFTLKRRLMLPKRGKGTSKTSRQIDS